MISFRIYQISKCTELRTTPIEQYFLGIDLRTTPFHQYFLGVDFFKIDRIVLNSPCKKSKSAYHPV